MLGGPMRPPRYALEPLARLRRDQADGAVRGLAAAVEARGAQERERLSAEQRRSEHDARVSVARDAEQEALARGELRAADLARGDAWEVRLAAERAAMTADVERRRASEEQARTAEGRARSELAAREADAGVIERDRARWSEQQGRQLEAREEEEAAEAYRPLR
jgi:hypothetical protein